MKDSSILPEFPVYADGFSEFKEGSSSRSNVMIAYIPDEQDMQQAMTIRHGYKLLASCPRAHKDVQATRPVIKKQGKKRRSEQNGRSTCNARRASTSRQNIPIGSVRLQSSDADRARHLAIILERSQEGEDDDGDFM
ncbi:hypothetical protein FGB62_203g024 [Gracilaria domingensis]|nr:hypothetical protein FGB62_203g024 [Gracilaria domingensis]